MHAISINTIPLENKIPRGSSMWGRYNQSFENMELPASTILDYICDGHGYSSHFDGTRKADNWTQSQWLSVDMDTDDERSSIPALMTHPFVQMYASFIYTTPSHMVKGPRARIVFLLDKAVRNVDSYGILSVWFSLWFAGVDSAASADVARFYYGAVNPTVEIIGEVLPVSHLRELYRRSPYRPEKPPPQQQHRPVQRQPVGDDEYKRTIAALNTINPNTIDYDAWIACNLAMRDTFGRAALPDVDRWANGYAGEVESIFNRPARATGKVAGLGTIFHLAKGH